MVILAVWSALNVWEAATTVTLYSSDAWVWMTVSCTVANHTVAAMAKFKTFTSSAAPYRQTASDSTPLTYSSTCSPLAPVLAVALRAVVMEVTVFCSPSMLASSAFSFISINSVLLVVVVVEVVTLIDSVKGRLRVATVASVLSGAMGGTWAAILAWTELTMVRIFTTAMLVRKVLMVAMLLIWTEVKALILLLERVHSIVLEILRVARENRDRLIDRLNPKIIRTTNLALIPLLELKVKLTDEEDEDDEEEEEDEEEDEEEEEEDEAATAASPLSAAAAVVGALVLEEPELAAELVMVSMEVKTALAAWMFSTSSVFCSCRSAGLSASPGISILCK